MNRWFDQDNPLMRTLSKVFDVCYLSLLWLLFAWPVFTAGAALTALYYTTVKVLRRERGYIFSEFWHSFKTNFKQATILWLGIMALSALMVFNLRVVSRDGGSMAGYLIGAYVAIAIVILVTTCYLFPVLSRFDLKIKKLVRFSFYLAMRHLPTTLLLLVVVATGVGGFGIGFFVPSATVLLFCFVPASCTWIFSFLMERVLKKYMPKQEEKKTEDGETITEWYME